MMNRRVIVNTVLGGIFGVALGSVGIFWHTWQFWMFMGVYVATVVNSIIPSEE